MVGWAVKDRGPHVAASHLPTPRGGVVLYPSTALHHHHTTALVYHCTLAVVKLATLWRNSPLVNLANVWWISPVRVVAGWGGESRH